MKSGFKKYTLLCLFFLSVFLITGCGTGGVDVPEDYTKYENKDHNFSLYYPEDWEIENRYSQSESSLPIRIKSDSDTSGSCKFNSETLSEEIKTPSNLGLRVQKNHRRNAISNIKRFDNTRHKKFSIEQSGEFQAGPHTAYNFTSRHVYEQTPDSLTPTYTERVDKTYFAFYINKDKKKGFKLVCAPNSRVAEFLDLRDDFKNIAKSLRFK